MRREDLNLHDQVLLRYHYKATIIGFSERLIEVDTGHKKMSVHYSDIIENYGGRENEKGI